MVLQHPVYSTRRHSGSSVQSSARPVVYLPRSQKDFLENHILRKREAEVRRLAYWTETSENYIKLARQSERYNQLTDPEVTRTSLEASNKEKERENRKQNLLGRRQRLKALLTRENEEFEAEFENLPAGAKPITDLRAEREKIRKERDEVMKKEAELKMLQHMKINNPKYRDQERLINNSNARQQIQLQIQEKKDLAERRRIENEEMDRRMIEEERRKIEESQRIEEERKIELAKLHRYLEQQMEDLRLREREMEVWQRSRAEQEELQRKAEEYEKEWKILEKKRLGREIDSYNKRQHKLALKMKTKFIQEELEKDRQRLAEMELLTKSQDDCHEEKKKRAIADLEWMKDVIRQQQDEEQRREKELELIFSEEADKMWKKQEEIWKKEETARQQLMEDVVKSWKHQMEERTSAARLVVDHEMTRMKEIEDDIRDLKQKISDKEKLNEQRRTAWVEDLDSQVQEKQRRHRMQRAENDLVRERSKEIEEENRLARSLAQLAVSNNPDLSAGDFRRRKVKWMF